MLVGESGVTPFAVPAIAAYARPILRRGWVNPPSYGKKGAGSTTPPVLGVDAILAYSETGAAAPGFCAFMAQERSSGPLRYHERLRPKPRNLPIYFGRERTRLGVNVKRPEQDMGCTSKAIR